jgi:hypothetical protein
MADLYLFGLTLVFLAATVGFISLGERVEGR